ARTVARENPYYLGIPFNDLGAGVDRSRIPWAADPGYDGRLGDRGFSFLKNRWVRVDGPRGSCYAQVEDVGPGPSDPGYVLGAARPRSASGINLSPAVAGCLGIRAAVADAPVAATDHWAFAGRP